MEKNGFKYSGILSLLKRSKADDFSFFLSSYERVSALIDEYY